MEANPVKPEVAVKKEEVSTAKPSIKAATPETSATARREENFLDECSKNIEDKPVNSTAAANEMCL